MLPSLPQLQSSRWPDEATGQGIWHKMQTIGSGPSRHLLRSDAPFLSPKTNQIMCASLWCEPCMCTMQWIVTAIRKYNNNAHACMFCINDTLNALVIRRDWCGREREPERTGENQREPERTRESSIYLDS